MKQLSILLIGIILFIPFFIIGITPEPVPIISKGIYSFKPSIQIKVNYTIDHYFEAKKFSKEVLEECSKEKETLLCVESKLKLYDGLVMGDCRQNINIWPLDFATERKVSFCKNSKIGEKDSSLKFALYIPDLVSPDDINGLVANSGLLQWDAVNSLEVVKILVLSSSSPFTAYDPALLVKELVSSITSFQGMASKYYMVYPVDAKGNIGNKGKPSILG